MNKKEFEQFLDTGWHSDATLYLNGRIYWCEGLINSKNGMFEFSVESWDVEIIDDFFFKSITTKDGTISKHRPLIFYRQRGTRTHHGISTTGLSFPRGYQLLHLTLFYRHRGTRTHTEFNPVDLKSTAY